MNNNRGWAPGARLRSDASTQELFAAKADSVVHGLQRHTKLDSNKAAEALAADLAPLRRALFSSPWWCQRLEAAGLSPNDLRGLPDLDHFPMIDRETLATRWRHVASEWEDPGLVVVKSSGTTGQPVDVLRSRYECLHMWVVMRFWVEHLGIELPAQPTVALWCALPGGLEYASPAPLFFGGQLERISLHRPSPYPRLEAAQPAVLSTDPAGLHSLRGRVPASVRMVMSSAQHLPQEFRSIADAPAVNYYAATETGPIAWECLKVAGRFHVLRPAVHAESVNGELVVTRLLESPLPLLRYRTGDSGHVRFVDCACGVAGQVIEALVGRRALWFQRPDGGRVDAWSLAWVFKHHALTEFRLAQTGKERFHCRVVGAADGLAERLRACLVTLGWTAPIVQVERVAALPASAKPQPFSADYFSS